MLISAPVCSGSENLLNYRWMHMSGLCVKCIDADRCAEKGRGDGEWERGRCVIGNICCMLAVQPVPPARPPLVPLPTPPFAWSVCPRAGAKNKQINRRNTQPQPRWNSRRSISVSLKAIVISFGSAVSLEWAGAGAVAGGGRGAAVEGVALWQAAYGIKCPTAGGD